MLPELLRCYARFYLLQCYLRFYLFTPAAGRARWGGTGREGGRGGIPGPPVCNAAGKCEVVEVLLWGTVCGFVWVDGRVVEEGVGVLCVGEV